MVARITPTKPVRHFLKEWRTKKRMTQQQLADEVQTGKDQISRWERNERGMTMDVQVALAQALGIEAPDLFRNPDDQHMDAVYRMVHEVAPELGDDETELLVEDLKRRIIERKELVERIRHAR